LTPQSASCFPKGEIGITTTVPVEVLVAAGFRPTDLNNRFISSPRAAERVALAERRGFPRSICAWVKGIYGTVVEEGVRTVLGVAEGDCSLTHALLEVLETEGVRVMRFDFPYDRSEGALDREIARLEAELGVTRAASEEARERLIPLRRKLAEVDEALAGGDLAPGMAERAHGILLSASDLAGGEPDALLGRAGSFVAEAKARRGRPAAVRLALAGVPPISSGIFDLVERAGARIVLSEMPREFAMVRASGTLLEQYLAYSYPYDVFHRLRALSAVCRERRANGVIHYVQSFCFRGVHDRLMRERLGLPVLLVECDRPGVLDARETTRIETFIETLGVAHHGGKIP
jgi:benzoyl-CoA reductase/2-hydroxyglutaryl-CoA dehydratase subunit BcrC/BadD/HgdB